MVPRSGVLRRRTLLQRTKSAATYTDAASANCSSILTNERCFWGQQQSPYGKDAAAKDSSNEHIQVTFVLSKRAEFNDKMLVWALKAAS